jgi:hypothetical protein
MAKRKEQEALVKQQAWEAKMTALDDRAASLAAERGPHLHGATQYLAQALASAKRALSNDPQEPAAHRAMALYFTLLDQTLQAEQELANIAEPDSSNWQDGYVRAQLLLAKARSAGQPEAGLQSLSGLYQSNPLVLRALYEIAATRFDQKQYALAQRLLRDLLAKNAAHERGRALLDLIPEIR